MGRARSISNGAGFRGFHVLGLYPLYGGGIDLTTNTVHLVLSMNTQAGSTKE